ncbi:hypothetical protein V5799_006017 [Amblyomma americanum]|uniref:Uncharacterized protein n=1 Tax=Amblyomma americanum TaxID=6943 RepID=A0AAQ4DXK6_AMBAM
MRQATKRSSAPPGRDLPPLLLLLLLSIAAASITIPTDDARGAIVASSVEDAFAQYVSRYNKSYEPGSAEYERRFAAFRDSLGRIERKSRSSKDTARYGLTRFSDFTPDEFRRDVLSPRPPVGAAAVDLDDIVRQLFPDLALGDDNDISPLVRSASKPAVNGASRPGNRYPDHFDWRNRSVVTAVKNQLNCGACWAISTVENVESMYAIATGKLVEFSVQQMVDCSNNSNHGCNGGDTCAAMQWLRDNRIHLATESAYPFTASTGTCRHPESDVTAELVDYTCQKLVGNEELMLDLIANVGPLATAVDATAWQDYLGGIIRYHCDAGRNHAVQVVGYDLRGDVPYYIVRNSWGPEYGHGGYLYIAVGKNLCGIAEEVSTVTIKKPSG